MKIVTLDRTKRIGNVLYRPYTRYVISDHDAYLLTEAENKVRYAGIGPTDMRISSFHPYEKRYAGQNANGKKIMLYRHNAYGDTLIASAIPRFIKRRWPHAKIYMYAHSDMFEMWRGNAFIEGGLPVPLPISLDAAKMFDYHVMYEGMLEGDSEPDQENCYDSMFQFINMKAPAHYKRPYIFIRPDDYAALEYLKGTIDLDEDYIVYHLNPNNLNRAYPFPLTRRFWELFLEAYPNFKIYVVGLDEYHCTDGSVMKGVRKPLFEGLPARVVNLLSKAKDFRHYIPIIENAKLVIGPDSSIGHLAACFPHVPVISLWAMFAPNDRVKYYANHYPLWHPDVCRICPCHNHTFDIPEIACRKNADVSLVEELGFGDPHLQWCAVLAAITPEEIMETTDRLLGGYKTGEHYQVAKADPEESRMKIEKENVDALRKQDICELAGS